ncbi:MAG TPA: hypothetical protein VLX60_02405 [Terriglobales bacterium]|nr:hypothetical protein [Terriglobales bacterium]
MREHVGLPVLTIGTAEMETVTVSASAETIKLVLKVAGMATCRASFSRVTLLKPGAEICRRYVPGGSWRNS